MIKCAASEDTHAPAPRDRTRVYQCLAVRRRGGGAWRVLGFAARCEEAGRRCAGGGDQGKGGVLAGNEEDPQGDRGDAAVETGGDGSERRHRTPGGGGQG